MTSESKLILFSRVLRVITVCFGIAFLSSVVMHYLFGIQSINLGVFSMPLSLTPWPSYQELKVTEGVSAVGIVFFPLLTFCVIGTTTYWFYRLFSFYAKGQFFGSQVTRCYMVILWMRVIDFLYTSFYDPLIWLFNPTRAGTAITVSFDTKAFITLVVLLVIAYILKLANQLDQENKAFV